MNPAIIPKETFRASLTRVLRRTANVQKAVRQQQQDLRSDLGACVQPVGLPQVIGFPQSDPVESASRVETCQQAAPVMVQEPQERVLKGYQTPFIQPSTDDNLFILVHVTDLYLAQGLQALAPNQILNKLRLYIKSPPNTEEELTPEKSVYLIEHTKLKALELSLIAELETTTGVLDFQLGAAYIDVTRTIHPVLYKIDERGERRNAFSRRRVNVIFSEVVPIHAVTISSNYAGRTDAIQGNLLIGAVDVSIFCGGQPLLDYEQSLRSKPCIYLDMAKYSLSVKKVSKSVCCSLETHADIEAYRELALGGRSTLVREKSGAVSKSALGSKQSDMQKVAAVCFIAKVSRVFFRNLGPVERIYAVATLQPTAELAAIIGYKLTQVHKLTKELREPGTSTAIHIVPYDREEHGLVYADTTLTISRKLALIPTNINYLLHGSFSLSIFGFLTGNSRKIFLGSVDIPLAECYSSGIVIGGWFSLSNTSYDGYVYAEASITRSTNQGNENWNSAEATEPPIFVPPAFSTHTVPPIVSLSPGPTIQLLNHVANVASGTFPQVPVQSLKEPASVSVPLLKPDAGVYEEIGNIVSGLNNLFVNF
ncbi:Hypothetical protein GLP15_612 [Giardia lamblia P15]|uniref:Uncharacterized protein n=1 Tax=Giardia intestinalis (strain P15) TaxID=658858 RepID=E1F579_GIAIA|nr:Hypothetical protein GLP15_612 [Giardia lamblia P15]